MNKKIKKQNTKIKQEKRTEMQKYWLYLCQESLTPSDLKEMLEKEYEVEYWEEAGVVEVELSEKESMDFEKEEIENADEATRKYFERYSVQSVFLVTIHTEEFHTAEEVMKKVSREKSGFFCGDTEDFQPIVRG